MQCVPRGALYHVLICSGKIGSVCGIYHSSAKLFIRWFWWEDGRTYHCHPWLEPLYPSTSTFSLCEMQIRKHACRWHGTKSRYGSKSKCLVQGMQKRCWIRLYFQSLRTETSDAWYPCGCRRFYVFRNTVVELGSKVSILADVQGTPAPLENKQATVTA